LTASIFPANATNTSILWTSSNESVATVSNGIVTAVGGSTGASATITATSVDQGKTATCVVTSTSAPRVLRSVPSQYATIQAAVTAATAGDTIDIAAGTYTERIICNKALTIQGAGMGSTIVQSNATIPTAHASGSTAFSLDAAYNFDATITLKNMTIQNGYNTYSGGGIRLMQTGTGTVTLNLYGLKICDNRTNITGGGMVVTGKVIVNIENCTISSNRCNANAVSPGGAGIAMSQATTAPFNLTIKNSTISNNTAGNGHGGGICVSSTAASSNATVLIQNSTIYGNTTSTSTRTGAGIYVIVGATTPSTLTLNHCTVANNTTNAGLGGDGIFVHTSSGSNTTLVLNNSIVMNNSGSTSNASQVHGKLTNGGITNSIFTVASGNTWFPSTGIDWHNTLDAVDSDLAFAGSLSNDSNPVLMIGSASIARNYVTEENLASDLTADQIGSARIDYPDAGAYEYASTTGLNISSENPFVLVSGKELLFSDNSGLVEIFNLMGSLVSIQKPQKSIISLKSGGIFMVKMTTMNGVRIQKVIVN